MEVSHSDPCKTTVGNFVILHFNNFTKILYDEIKKYY